jgi:hypothetical protein
LRSAACRERACLVGDPTSTWSSLLEVVADDLLDLATRSPAPLEVA